MTVKNLTGKFLFLASVTATGLLTASPMAAVAQEKIVNFTPAPGLATPTSSTASSATPSSTTTTSPTPAAAASNNPFSSFFGQPGDSSTQPGSYPNTVDRASFLQSLNKLQSDKDKAEAQRQADLGTLDNPDSPRYKANKLADEAKAQREEESSLKKSSLTDEQGMDAGVPPPQDITRLQDINKYQAGTSPGLTDDPINKELALDMRKSAQKEAALSYGARGGLAKRNYEIMEQMRGFDGVLDRVFNFRQLLIKAPSGLLIEPPIVKESANALLITDTGDEAAVADRVYDINKKAKIVSAPRDWRTYLLQTWADVPPPPHVLWPRNAQEQADWSTWVAQGWDAGLEQADQIFEANVNRLVADYNGMVRYRMLLAQDMISAPYAMHEDRGITGDQNQMRVGDRAVRITGPSQFLTKAELWKPADR